MPATERAAIKRTRPRPPRVTNLAPYRDGRLITLGWHNPDAALYRHVVVRYRPGSDAQRTPRDGRAVHVASARATTATLRHLRPGRQYTAAVWTRDAIGRLSPRTATTFVVPVAVRRASATLTGRLTDIAGSALSGVVVSVTNENDGQTIAATVTGTNGRYRMRVPAAEYGIDLEGSNGTGGNSDASGYLERYRSVTLLPHKRTTVNAALAAGAALVGRVTDVAGNPLGGIDAGAQPAWNYVGADMNDFGFSFDFLEQQVSTRKDGSFALKGLYPDSFRACFDPNDGSYYSTDVGFGYSQQCAETPHQLHRGQVIDIGSVPLATTPRGAVTGRVITPSGTGIGRAAVTASPVGRRYSVAYVQTGPQGGYTLGGLKPGLYRVCADPSGTTNGSRLGYLGRCRTRRVRVSESSVTRGQRIVLYPGGAISGVVRAANGAPVTGASVTLGDPFFSFSGALTDAQGRWTITGVRSGRVPLCVDASTAVRPRGMPFGVVSACTEKRHRAVVRRGRVRIGADMVLAAGGAIRGVATSSGRPARFVDVSSGMFGADLGRQADTLTDPRGRFVLRGLEPGRYHLCFFDGWANDENHQTCADRRVTVRPRHAADYGTAKLAPSGRLRVRVTDTSGRALNGVDVAVLKPCRRLLCDRSPLIAGRFRVAASWTTYGDGTVTLGALPRSYAVCFFGYLAAPAHGATPLTGYTDTCTPGYGVRVRAGRSTTVSSSLALAGEITGTVTDTTGEPVAGAQLHITGSAVDDVPRQIYTWYDDPTEPGSITGADGTYAVRSIAPGDATVCIDPTEANGPRYFQWQCLGAAPGKHKGGSTVTVRPGQVTVGVDVVLHS